MLNEQGPQGRKGVKRPPSLKGLKGNAQGAESTREDKGLKRPPSPKRLKGNAQGAEATMEERQCYRKS